jgi:hypothetical protein
MNAAALNRRSAKIDDRDRAERQVPCAERDRFRPGMRLVSRISPGRAGRLGVESARDTEDQYDPEPAANGAERRGPAVATRLKAP